MTQIEDMTRSPGCAVHHGGCLSLGDLPGSHQGERIEIALYSLMRFDPIPGDVQRNAPVMRIVEPPASATASRKPEVPVVKLITGAPSLAVRSIVLAV